MIGAEGPQDNPFSRTLARRAADHASGLFTARRGRLKRLFSLENGWLVHATSNLVEEQFVEYLVRHGALAAQKRTLLLEEAEKKRRRPVSLLLERKTIVAESLRRSMEKLVTDLLSSSIEWREGEFSFEAGRPDLRDEVTVRLSPIHLVLAHGRRFPASLDAVRVRLGPPDLRPAADEHADHILAGLELEPTAKAILEACDGKHTLAGILQLSGASQDTTLRWIHALSLIGVLRTHHAGLTVAERKDEALSRAECVTRFRVPAGSSHYLLLGLTGTAKPQQIRDAYYALARRYHPDRFRAGSLEDLLPMAETFFSSVTEAYNTLSRPELRKEYDESLADEQAASGAPGPSRTDTVHLARENFLRARALTDRKHHQDAVRFLENAVQLDPNQAEYHLELGKLLTRNPRRRDEAETRMRRAAELDPASPVAYVALGELFVRAGRGAEAMEMFREALRWDPLNADASARLAALSGTPEASTR